MEILLEEDTSQLLGIYYQEQHMKKIFSDFPELLMIDSTYKLNDLRMPLYVLLVVDGNGESEIIATFLTANETENTIRRMINIFKEHNPGYANIKAIISDKDFVERMVLHEEIPQAAMLICLFHVLRTFRREVTCEKMGIRASQRDLCLNILQQIVYSRNSDEYEQNLARLRETNIQSVITYYMTNWHNIKEQFVECFKGENLTLGNRTNNRLESINGKIKSVCARYCIKIKYPYIVRILSHDNVISIESCHSN